MCRNGLLSDISGNSSGISWASLGHLLGISRASLGHPPSLMVVLSVTIVMLHLCPILVSNTVRKSVLTCNIYQFCIMCNPKLSCSFRSLARLSTSS